jgi:hypothetical protein
VKPVIAAATGESSNPASRSRTAAILMVTGTELGKFFSYKGNFLLERLVKYEKF